MQQLSTLGRVRGDVAHVSITLEKHALHAGAPSIFGERTAVAIAQRSIEIPAKATLVDECHSHHPHLRWRILPTLAHVASCACSLVTSDLGSDRGQPSERERPTYAEYAKIWFLSYI